MDYNEDEQKENYNQKWKYENNYNKSNNPENSYTLLIVLLLIMFIMYAYFQEERYSEINQRLQKIEQYTNYLF